MIDRRKQNVNWNVANADGDVPTWERVNTAVLMDIRSELQRLNSLLACPNFTAIPRTLLAIRLNTTKRRSKAK
jgi:hypothetical protein